MPNAACWNAIIFEACVLRDLLAEIHKLIELVFKLLAFHHSTFGDEFPRFLSERAIWFFEELAHRYESFFLAAKLHGERSAEFLVLLADLRLFGFEGNVFLAIQLDVILHVADEHIVARRWQVRALRMSDEKFLQFELARLELRLDVFDELQISLLRIGVVRVTGHGDVAAGGFFVERGTQFAPREQPRFEVGGGLGGGDAGFELVEEWRELRPITQVELRGHELARLVSGQRTERQ